MNHTMTIEDMKVYEAQAAAINKVYEDCGYEAVQTIVQAALKLDIHLTPATLLWAIRTHTLQEAMKIPGVMETLAESSWQRVRLVMSANSMRTMAEKTGHSQLGENMVHHNCEGCGTDFPKTY